MSNARLFYIYNITFLILFVNKKEIEIKLIISTSMNKNEKLKKNNIKKIKNQKSKIIIIISFFIFLSIFLAQVNRFELLPLVLETNMLTITPNLYVVLDRRIELPPDVPKTPMLPLH